MNERMYDIALEVLKDYPTLESWTFSRQELELFTELIVRECMDSCESVGKLAEQTNFGEMARKTKATANGCAKMIAWRFGVEYA